MAYTFEINSGSWVEVNPIFNGGTLERIVEDDNIRVRDLVGGTLTFFGADFDTLKAILPTSEYSFRVKLNGVVKVTGLLNLLGEYNDKEKVCKFSFTQSDQYTEILKNIDKEFSLRGYLGTPVLKPYESFINTVNADYALGAVVGTGIVPGFVDGLVNDSIQLYSATTQYTQATLYTEDNGASLWYGDLNDCFATNGSGGYFVAIQDNLNKDLPAIGEDNDYWAPLATTTGQIKHNVQEYADYQFDSSATYDEENNRWTLANDTFSDYVVNTYAVRMFLLLELLLTQADSTININESTYCPYFDTWTQYKKMYFTDFSNEPFTKLSDIFNMYLVIFNLDWKIDSSKNFYFVHPSEINKTVPVIGTNPEYHLNDYKGNNWTVWNYNYDFSEHINKETWQFGESDDENFTIQTIDYDNSFEDDKAYTTGIQTDFKAAQTAKDGQLLMVTILTEGVQNIQSATRPVAPFTPIINGDVSTIFCVYNHHFYNRPFASGEFLGSTYTLEQKRSNEITISVPVQDPTIWDFENLVKTDLADIELKQVTVNMDGQIAELKGVFK